VALGWIVSSVFQTPDTDLAILGGNGGEYDPDPWLRVVPVLHEEFHMGSTSLLRWEEDLAGPQHGPRILLIRIAIVDLDICRINDNPGRWWHSGFS